MPRIQRQPRPYTLAPAGVSPGFASRQAPRARDVAKPREGRGSGRAFLALLLAVTGGWIFAAANPAQVSAMAARLTSVAMGYGAPGIEIVRTEARRTVSDGQTILYVDGTLANKAQSPLKPPRLVITIVGEDDQPLYTWTSRVAQNHIDAAHEAPFQARLLSPPDTFKSIRVALAAEG